MLPPLFSESSFGGVLVVIRAGALSYIGYANLGIGSFSPVQYKFSDNALEYIVDASQNSRRDVNIEQLSRDEIAYLDLKCIWEFLTEPSDSQASLFQCIIFEPAR